MVNYPIRKRYQHTHMFDEILVTGDMTVEGTFTFGDASFDTFILKGRMSTMTAAGSAIDIGSTYTYGEGMEYRWTVSAWTGVGSSFKGMYVRAQADLGGAYGLRSAEFYSVMNTSTTTGLSSLQNVYAEMLVKASASNRTLTDGHCIEANISVENQTGTLTLTNDIYCLYAKAQTGTGINDYTKVNGIKIGGRDDGTARVFGKALDISDPEATVCTWTTGINISTNCVTGINLAGTPTGDVIDFSNITWAPNASGSSGNCLIRAGSYGTPITNDSEYQSGMIRIYGRTTDLNASYDRGIFVGLKTQGSKGIIPVAGLAEIENTASGNGPTKVHACEFIANLLTTGAKVASTATMHGGWFKVAAKADSTISVGAIVSPLWVDNQLYGSNIGSGGFLATEYGIYATTGGSQPRAFVGFSTTSSGYVNFLSFDSTIASQSMIGTGDIDGGTADKYLKIDMNGTAYAIQMYAL